MEYGISGSKSLLISNIARSLNETIKLGNTVERLCDNLNSLNDEIVPEYHVCEATILTSKEKQPISVYSEIYSCQSNSFKSMNYYTKKSIEMVRKTINRKCNMIFDRGYDQNWIGYNK